MDRIPSFFSILQEGELKSNTTFLDTGASDITCNTNSSGFIPNESKSTWCSYIRILKVVSRNPDVFTLFKQQSVAAKDSNQERVLGLDHLDDANCLAVT